MSTHLRIAHWIDLEHAGCEQRVFYRLLQTTPPEGFFIEHCTLADSRQLAPGFDPQVLSRSGWFRSARRWHGLPLPGWPHALRALNCQAQLKAFQPDLIVAWNRFTDFRLLRNRTSCPLVYYEQGMSWQAHALPGLQDFLPHVDAAIAGSHAAARMLSLQHRITVPVMECPNPLRPELQSSSASVRSFPHHRPLRIGVAARLAPHKAIGLLVLALGHLLARGVMAEVWIAGEGPERAAIEALAEREGLVDQVRMLGQVEDMTAFYREIDLFVLTSMHESWSQACIEAMTYGLPVIAAAIDGIPEVVQDRVSGRCLIPSLSPEDYAAMTGASTAFSRTVYDPVNDGLADARLLAPEIIAEAVEQLCRDPATYRTMSSEALGQARRGFLHADYLQRFYSLLADVAQKC
jgi:glycosyltransferase involved in cell wall biosynthesis